MIVGKSNHESEDSSQKPAYSKGSVWKSLQQTGMELKKLGLIHIIGGVWIIAHSTILGLTERKSSPYLVAIAACIAVFVIHEAYQWSRPKVSIAIALFVLVISILYVYLAEGRLRGFSITVPMAWVGSSPDGRSKPSPTVAIFAVSIQNNSADASLAGYSCGVVFGGKELPGTYSTQGGDSLATYVASGDQQIFRREDFIHNQAKGQLIVRRTRIAGWFPCAFRYLPPSHLRSEATRFYIEIMDDQGKAYRHYCKWQWPVQERPLSVTPDWLDTRFLDDPGGKHELRSSLFVHFAGKLSQTTR